MLAWAQSESHTAACVVPDEESTCDAGVCRLRVSLPVTTKPDIALAAALGGSYARLGFPGLCVHRSAPPQQGQPSPDKPPLSFSVL